MTENISTVFWDVGAVLFSEAQISRREFKPVRDLLGVSVEESDQIFDEHWLNEVRLGEISEDEFWKFYLDVSRKKPTIEEIKTLYRNCIRVNNELWNFVKGLAEKYDQYVLSNHGREWMQFLSQKWQFSKYFKDIYCSAWLGVAKPERKFYEIAIKESGEVPKEILYIDDNSKNVDVASSMGIHGIIYKSNEQVIEDMKSYGVEV